MSTMCTRKYYKSIFAWIAKKLVNDNANRDAQTSITLLNIFKYERKFKFKIVRMKKTFFVLIPYLATLF